MQAPACLLRCTLVANGTKRQISAPQQTVAFGGKATFPGRPPILILNWTAVGRGPDKIFTPAYSPDPFLSFARWLSRRARANANTRLSQRLPTARSAARVIGRLRQH